MPRFADGVPFPREDYQFRCNVEVAQRAKEFLALRNGHSLIVLAMNHERGSLNAARVAHGRVFPIQIEVFEEIPAEIAAVPIEAVADSFQANEIGNTRDGHSRLEPVRTADNPFRHEPAIACTGHA